MRTQMRKSHCPSTRAPSTFEHTFEQVSLGAQPVVDVHEVKDRVHVRLGLAIHLEVCFSLDKDARNGVEGPM